MKFLIPCNGAKSLKWEMQQKQFRSAQGTKAEEGQLLQKQFLLIPQSYVIINRFL
jgi:hypothetical protein